MGWRPRAAFRVALSTHPNPNPTAAEKLTVAAVGGYGRAEMAPYSDVDLLFLRPYKRTAWSESVIETMLYLLWDLRLKVGHSVRTIDECVRLSRDDVTIRTALLEKRLLAGDPAQLDDLDRRLWQLFDKTGLDFVEAKLAERDGRHRRHGGSRYLVEPNIKESKGGLRDLQTLYWIAKYLYHADSVADLVAQGVFTQDEVETFSQAHAFLWTVRCHLHFLAGRAQEQLSFDVQVDIAERLGYDAAGGQRAVERFMQDYFRAAKDVGDLTRWFCAGLEQAQKKRRPGFRSLVRALRLGGEAALSPGFVVRDGRIDIESPAVIERDPVAMLRVFQECLDTGALIHPAAMRLIAGRLDLVDDAMRADPEANRLFMRLLTRSADPERMLRRMNESGILGRFIPQFGRVVAMMQFNMYHHYTVDEHTILAISILKRIEKGELAESLPVASEILRTGVDAEVLYLALFLHDIGKGLPSDHAEVGAAIALELGPRLGLDPAQTDMVSWLVREHLLMSDTAQKRDIADPRTVRAFADVVRSPERLRLLTVLTVCDIRAVGPGVWNNWKAQLLRTLFWDTRGLLTGGTERLGRAERVQEAKAALAAAMPDAPAEVLAREGGRHYAPYWLGLDTETHVALTRLSMADDVDQPRIDIAVDTTRGATRVAIVIEDHPGIFGRMAAALSLARASVLDARTFTSTDGMATSAFWIQGADGQPYEPEAFQRLSATIQKALRGDLAPRKALREKRRATKRRERSFDAPTRIVFDNEASDIYTVIEVDTRDRLGLLYDLTSALSAANINIFSAVIATYGEQAVDVFYVKDLFGLKIGSPNKQASIARRLRAAIDRAADDMG
jgi:[protein-PII] uridylyltransferase